MDSNEGRELIRAIKRVAESLERIELKMCGARPAPTVPGDLPKDVASAVQLRRGGDRGDVADDRGLVRGGVPPEIFWSRREP